MSPGAERFYITGGTLPSHAASYIVRQADKDLYQGLCDGEFCYVLNTRQIGKSSLMVRCAQQLRAQGHQVALLDLTAIGQNVTIEAWYDGLLTLVAEQLRLRDEMEDFWLEHERLGPMQRWMETIRRVALERFPQRLFLFIDEIDCVRSLPFTTDEFFVGIRECYNRRVQDPAFERLTFCLLGVATPADLITDTRLSPFNIGRRIVLNDFTFEEALPLASGLTEGTQKGGGMRAEGATDGALDLLKRALGWTGGHPYLTQRLCAALAQTAHPLQASDVERACRELFLHPQAHNTDDNLAFVRNCLLRSEAESSALLDVYRQVRLGARVKEDPTDPVHRQLKLSGIVRGQQGLLQVRNRIYAQAFDARWLEANMPDAELRRQRLAYRRGIVRAATSLGILVALIAAVVGLVGFKISHDRAEKSAAQLLYITDMDRVQQEWEAGNITHVLELLAETRHSPERNIEWDYWNRICHQSIRTFKMPARTFATAFAPDGTTLASLTEGGDLEVREVATGKVRLKLSLLGDAWRGLTFSPNGAELVTALGEDIQIRDALSGRLKRTLSSPRQAHEIFIDSVAYSADGRFLVSRDNRGVVTVWAPAQGRKLFVLENADNRFLACAVNRGQVVTCRKDGLVQFRTLETGKLTRSLQTSLASPALTLSHDGTLLAGADRRGDIQVINIATRNASFFAANEGPLNALAFTADDARLVAAHNLALNVWDLRSGRLLATYKEHLQQALSLAVSRDDRYVAWAGLDALVKVWDLHVPTDPLIVPVSDQPVWHVQYSSDGRRVLTCSGDGCAAIWDVSTGKLLRRLRAGQDRLTCAVFSHDDASIATSDVHGRIVLWEADTGRRIRDFVGHSAGVNNVVFSPNDRQLFSAGDDRATIQWEVATGRLLHRFLEHKKAVESLAVSGDGKRLLTGCDDKSAILWDVASRQPLRRFTVPAEVWGVALSPDGQAAAISNLNNTVDLYDLDTGRRRFTLRGHTNWLVAVTFSPDGKRIATSSRDGTAKVWDTATGRELWTLRGHERQVCGVAFSPGEQRIATVGEDGTLRLWDATPLLQP